MAVDKLVDSTKLNNSLEYTADRIRLKTGGSADILFDFENEKGFGDAIDAIPVGSTRTATLTGSGGGYLCYVDYSGNSYYSEGSFTFHGGETLTAHVVGNIARIKINDTYVVDESGGYDTHSGSYVYTLPDKDITIDFYTSPSSSWIIITETGSGGSILIEDTTDSAGGTVRTITALTVEGTKSITANGTGIDVASYATVDVAVPASQPNLQAKTNISPTTSSQTIQADSGYDGLSSVQINAMPSGTAGTPTATKGTVSNHSVSVTPSVTNTTGYITGSTKTGTAVTVSASELVSGSETKTSNGTYDVTNLAELVVNVPAGKNAQFQSKTARTSSNTYTDMGFEITVAKAGTYDIYWTGYRSSTGGTNGSQIYKNGSSVGTVHTTFDGTYTNVQNGHESNVSCAVNDKITIRARARSSSYYMYIMNLAIIEA